MLAGIFTALFRKEDGRFKSCVIGRCGLVWSFWHTPLWFVTGLQAEKLLLYIVTFIIGNPSLATVIAVSYHRCNNMAIPMWIHFISNAAGTLLAAGIDQALEFRCWGVLFYVVAAVAFAVWHILHGKKLNASDHEQDQVH